MNATVKALLDLIDSLPKKLRDDFEGEWLERTYQKEVKKARQIAKKKGITVADIDRKIEKMRYAK